MKLAFRSTVAALLIACFVSVSFADEPAPSPAPVRVADVFGDNMVLQRGRPLPVWGWAEPGETITVSVAGKETTTTAGDDGKWSVELPALDAGGPHEMTVKGKETRTFANVLVGEVWVCSGQSNMQWSVNAARDAQEEVAKADYPKIRLFTVPNKMTATPEQDSGGQWQVCSPQTVGGFSAVGYFFGRELYKDLDVPVGLINTSWGGSLCEAWTSREKLESDSDFAAILERAKDNLWNGTGMFNKMIAPLIPYGIRGAIWYQGESNVSRAVQYRKLFPAMIADWREHWGQGEFPFLYVQLAPFRYGGQDPRNCAELWESQFMTLGQPNTGMAVITDIGNVRDIHPKNKQDVGKRLALWTLANTYGKKDLVFSGPLYDHYTIEGDKIRVFFTNVGGGLKSSDDKPLSWFTIAGSDEKFVSAVAEIDGDTVIVHSDDVKNPVAVRFGWSDAAQPNLCNVEGLPASPFRTDEFKAATADAK